MSAQEVGHNSPYRGLEPFDERDAAFFFGRERETQLITASLFASPLTLLYGASGVGKTSVLRAGVLARLRERRELLPFVFPTLGSEPQSKSASVVLRGWQNDPLGGIKEAAAIALYASAGDDLALYRRFQDTVLTYEMAPLREFLTACHEVSGRRLMVILDQFEEYSLYHPEDDAFAEQFPAAITPGDLSVSFLISLREDALAKLDRFKGRIPALWDSYRRVDHLDRVAAEKAIRLPLREYNRQHPGSEPMDIETPLVEEVLRQVQTGSVQFDEAGAGKLATGKAAERRIETPYLQMVLERLWDKEITQGSRMMQLTTLRDLGGRDVSKAAEKIVRTHLDKVMERLGETARDTAARVLRFMVTPNGAKIALDIPTLANWAEVDGSKAEPVMEKLTAADNRVLRAVAPPPDQPKAKRYEVYHDVLATAILDWRARYVKAQELAEAEKRAEVERQRADEQARQAEKLRKALERPHTSLSVEWKINTETAEFFSPPKESEPNQILIFGDWLKDGAISATITPISGQPDANLGHDWKECAIVFRYEDREHFYVAGIGGFGTKFYIAKVTPSEWRLLEGTGLAREVKFGMPYPLRVEFTADRLALFNDDVPILNVIDTTYSSGFCGLRVNRTEGQFTKVDIYKVKPKCFVITPFDRAFLYVYDVIKSVVEQHDMVCLRADERHMSEPIIEDVKSKIAEADIIVVDFTNRNPNVYFEAGLAEAWKKKWIVLAQSANDLAFDVQHIRSIIYSDRMGADSELKESLGKALKETLGVGRTP